MTKEEKHLKESKDQIIFLLNALEAEIYTLGFEAGKKSVLDSKKE